MKRVLSVQDISCVGKCSLGVALPILSVMGLETCVLPTAVLSGHTAFRHIAKTDLTGSLQGMEDAWKKEDIRFDAIESGYLGSIEQIRIVEDLWAGFAKEGCLKVCDPAMGDHGKLYRGFDEAFVLQMKELCSRADVILPNLTEVCLLTDTSYRENFTDKEVRGLLEALSNRGTRCVIMTGYREIEKSGADAIGAAVYEADTNRYFVYCREKFDGSYFGTGDIFAAVVTGAILCGSSVMGAVKLAVEFTKESIKKTIEDPERRWYGTSFERALPWLADKIGKEKV